MSRESAGAAPPVRLSGSAQPWRLAQGGRIERTQPIDFQFEGRRLTGYAGDTLASALLAAGRIHCGDSMYLGRPRGIVSAGVEEPNALVKVAARTEAAKILPELEKTNSAAAKAISTAVSAAPGFCSALTKERSATNSRKNGIDHCSVRT